MLNILNKYLIRETLYTSISVLVILLVILSSNTMMRLIEAAAEGNFPTYLLFPTILIKITQYSIYLIPISLFFGILLALGKFYNSNEMAVISSAGQSPINLGMTMMYLVLPTSIIVGIFTLYITPLATDYRYKIEHRLANEERIEEIKPGRFTSSQSGTATFFVEGLKDGDLNNIFFSSLRDDKGTVESSYSASYFFDEDERKYILLKKGIINELLDGVQNRITTYKEHVIQLGQNLPTYTNNRAAAKSTIELMFSDKKTDSAELQSRLLLPLTTLILGLLAIPLSYSAPKKGRYSKVFLGITAYFIYFISISIIKKLYLLGYTPDFMGIWWIHIIALGIVALLYYNDNTKIPGRS